MSWEDTWYEFYEDLADEPIVTWQIKKKVKETKKALLLAIDNQRAFWIPKAAVTSLSESEVGFYGWFEPKFRRWQP